MPSIVNDLHRRRPDAVVSTKTTKPTIAQVGKTWGRDRDVSTLTVLLSLCILVFCPLMVIYFWVACNGFSCSLTGPVEKLLQLYTKTGSAGRALMLFTDEEFPKPSSQGYQLYAGWLLFQGLCYAFLPAAIGYGQRTPAGHLLPYKVNGLLAWVVTHVLFLAGSLYFDLFPGSIIHNNWGGLLVAANVYGYFLTFFSYAKALLFPSHPEDRKFSGSIIYDIFMGVEFNPRFGKLWDFKLFHNGRPGIIAWTLINLSFAFAQYEKIGYVTNSMILLNFLHAVYVLDFFYNEDWYLRTIDIAHDHFGFYLSWGDSVWLPFMYTMQSNYLLQNPIDLSAPYFLFVLCTGLSGYFIFRSVNHQKDIVRRTDGKCMVWGKPAKVIRAPFLTSDGVPRESLLLASGYWGISRHFNYVGDLLISLAMCLTCGFGHLLPYFYIIYMSILLLHRIQRDDARCRGKYGPYWEEYCKAVPFKLLPPVY